MRKVKVAFAGDASVGKTCIIERIRMDSFSEEIESTVGAANCTVDIDTGDEGVFQFNIWDTAGQERYRALTPMYFQNAALIFLVFDLTKTETLEKISEFIDLFDGRAPDYAKVVLVGNKADLIDERAVSEKAGEDCAREIGAEFYFEVSAKTGMGVKDLFTRAALIQGLHVEKTVSDQLNIADGSSGGSKGSGGCC